MRIRSSAPCAALAVALGLSAPALASSPQHGAREGAGGAGAPHTRTSLPAVRSTGFAGYRVNAKVSSSDITATIVVPKLKCTKANRAIAASAGMYEDSKTKFSSANLFVGCVNGKARYFPFLTVKGHESNFTKTTAHPGDMVVLKAVAHHSKTTVSVFDETHSFSKTKHGSGFSHFVRDPWVGDVTWSTKHGAQAVPRFGQIQFSTATINGNPFGSQPALQRVNRYNRTKTKLQIKTSNLGTDEESFSTLYQHP